MGDPDLPSGSGKTVSLGNRNFFILFVYLEIDIIQYFKLYSAASVKFVIMTQLLADSAPPVRIGSFASNNKIASLDVKRRHPS